MEYYVSTTGNNTNAGTLIAPWATWDYGFNNLSSGDTLYIRGGTYTPASFRTVSSRNCAVAVSSISGTTINPIQVFAYQNEVPILDCRNVIGGNERIGILLLNSSYWHLRGLRITRVDQPVGSPASVGGQGIFIWGISSATHNTIENCKAYQNGGPGMGTRDNVTETYFLNCDCYNNWDEYSSTPGGNSDGFDVGYSNGTIRFKGCRVWHNGDDGYDMYNPTGWNSIIYLTNCWAWHHGYSPSEGAGGDGSGFKLGTGTGLQSDGTTRRYLYNCLSYDNSNNGYDQNAGNMKTVIYNSVAYLNHARGFNFQWEDQSDILRNNISYDNDSADAFQASQTHDHNSWDSAVTVTDADFSSITGSLLETTRQVTGGLPVIAFLHLVTGSDLIGAGINVGILTDGDGYNYNDPPSIGAFEYGSTPPPDNIPVESIEITAPSYFITTDNGTLQFSASILPVDATNHSIAWSVTAGTGTASISPSGLLTALTNGTVTVVATAVDGSGISGSKIVTITGQVTGSPPTSGLRDRDGNPYTSIVINDQEWIVENLRTTHYADGEPIINLKDCTNPNGALYNYYAATYSAGGASIAPAGWHVPSLSEFQTLLNFVDTYDAVNNRWPLAGNYLRESGQDHWAATSINVTNSSGFTAFGSGVRSSNGSFEYIYFQTWLLTSTLYSPGLINVLNLASGSSIAILNDNPSDLNAGNPLRLIKDDSTDPGTMTDYDSNVYNTVKIGSQVWMAENLKVTHYNDGTVIPELTDDGDWSTDTSGAMSYYQNDPLVGGWALDTLGAYVWFDNDISYKEPYGALYNYLAVTNIHEIAYLERNGIQEDGWHVPTLAEWQALSTYLGGDAISGGKLKEIGLTHWTTPNAGATNEVGFSALGGGLRLADCTFYVFNLEARIWISTGGHIQVFYNDPGIAYSNPPAGAEGLSIRLVRDYPTEPTDPADPDDPTDPPPPPTDEIPPLFPPMIPPSYEDVIPYNYGALPVYRFYISTAATGSGISYEVFPLKFLSSTLVDELENNQVFYRRKFNGSLLFGTNSRLLDSSGIEQDRRDDWLLFWTIENMDPEMKLYITITKEFGGFIDTYWEGYFATSEGKFDIDICTFEVTPLPIDDYSLVLDLADTQYNFLANDGVASMGTVSATIVGGSAAGTYNYTRMRWLTRLGEDNILEFIAQNIAPGSTVVSEFFTNPINPVTLEDNHLLYLTIAQKSDITRYISSDPATVALLSWNELMEILWVMFEVRWTYNLATNTFTIEHVSDFSYSAGIDLREQLSCIATNKYQYLREKMPKYESFSFLDSSGVNFVGTPIYYDSAGVNQDQNSNSVEYAIPVVVDIEFLIAGGGAGSDEGFVILCNNFDGADYTVRSDFGRYDNSFLQLNMDLSVANLQHYYHKYDRVLAEGYMNGTLQTFFTSRKVKKQECSAILCDEFDPMGTITTELGETYFGGAKAIVKTASLSPTGEMKFVLLYGPLPSENPGVPDDIFGVTAYPELDSYYEPDDTINIIFVFNKPCPGDYDIRVQEIVYDNVGAVHDTGAWEDITFLTGTTGYTFNPAYHHALAAGWTVRLHFEYTASEIDIFRGVDPAPSFMWVIPYEYTAL